MADEIDPACLRPAESWTPPTGEEVRAVLRMAGLSGAQAARRLGLGEGGGRTVRRWTGEDSRIPYAAWALLCEMAGLGIIWHESREIGPVVEVPPCSECGNPEPECYEEDGQHWTYCALCGNREPLEGG